MQSTPPDADVFQCPTRGHVADSTTGDREPISPTSVSTVLENFAGQMSVGHTSRELVSTPPSEVTSTEAATWFHPDDEFPRFPRIDWQAFASTQMEEAFFNTAISLPWPASHSSLLQSLLRLVATRSAFQCCSFVASGASFLCRLQLAGVASHLTVVATTGEVV